MAAGSVEIEEALKRLYSRRLWGAARKESYGLLLDAEDIIQETAIALLRNHSPYRGKGALDSWLYGILAHKAADIRRRQWRRRRYYDDDENAEGELSGLTCASRMHEPSAEEHLLREEKRRAILRALDALPAKYSRVLMLRYYYDWDVGTIAQSWGKSYKMVESTLTRARNALARSLREEI